jgi:NTP pyrophosphatase (non-canonical NTP hydrolase)
MNFNGYQNLVKQTAIYPNQKKLLGLVYCILGLGSEAGEVQGKLKKIIRDKNSVFTKADINELKKELGDNLWYISQSATELGLSLEEVAEANIEKLRSRLNRGKVGGSGDNR